MSTPIKAIDVGAEQFAVPEAAWKLAQILVQGSRDLLVLLLEPTEIWSEQAFEDIYGHSWAPQKVDEELRYAPDGRRTLRNTCTVDI